MNIHIRSEKASDYSRIAQINYEAFLGWHPDNFYVSESILVDVLRHNTLFDPELSLVAELEGNLVGHVLFSPYEFIVQGTRQKGLVLAPIAILPEYQRLGIGGRLIQEGHRRAREKGYSLSLLCGHTAYYPRFGYQTRMFSLSGCEVRMNEPEISVEGMEERPVFEKDVPWITAQWEKQHQQDSLALFPGNGVCDWCNHSPAVRASVFVSNGKVVGYARYTRTQTLTVKDLLVEAGWVDRVIAYIMKKRGTNQAKLSLPASLISAETSQIKGVEVIDTAATHAAFMICPLEEQGIAADYCNSVASGELKPGLIVFTNAFDIDDGRTE